MRDVRNCTPPVLEEPMRAKYPARISIRPKSKTSSRPTTVRALSSSLLPTIRPGGMTLPNLVVQLARQQRWDAAEQQIEAVARASLP